MIDVLWGNPLAWVGVAAVAVPILVHLLAMRRARSVPFPAVRFLPGSSSTSVRRHRIEDWPLLGLRCLIILAAVCALAQPWLLRDDRSNAPLGAVRAVVVDASASMLRDTPGGVPAGDVARQLVERLVAEASTSTTIETIDLRAGIARAAAWLDTVTDGGAVLVVVSDFQVGAFEPADLTMLPATVGVQLERIDVVAEPRVELPEFHLGEERWAAAATLDDENTEARWEAISAAGTGADSGRRPGISGDAGGIDWIVGPDEEAGAVAAMEAAVRVTPVPTDATTLPVTVVWPGAADRAELVATSEPVNEPWMADVLAAMPPSAGVTAASRDSRLLLFADAEPGSLDSASLTASLLRGVARGTMPASELEPRALTDEVLRRQERPASAQRVASGSDGRWLWLLVLGLLLLEQWVRRPAGEPDVS